MLKSENAYVQKERESHFSDVVKTHSEKKAKVVPNENKTHTEEVCKLIPGKGNSDRNAAPRDGGLTLDSGVPKKIVPPSVKSEPKKFS